MLTLLETQQFHQLFNWHEQHTPDRIMSNIRTGNSETNHITVDNISRYTKLPQYTNVRL